MAEAPVVLELADVVDEEELGVLDRARLEEGVEVDRKGEVALAQPACRDGRVRLLDDRRRAHHDLGLPDGRRDVGRLLDLALELGASFRMGVEGADRYTRVQLVQKPRMEPALLAAAENRRGRPSVWSPAPDADTAGCRGAGGRDLGRVHDGQGQSCVRIVQDQEPRDVGEPARFVSGVARNPFERGHVLVGQVGGHGVDERVFPRMHTRLGRELDASGGER